MHILTGLSFFLCIALYMILRPITGRGEIGIILFALSLTLILAVLGN